MCRRSVPDNRCADTIAVLMEIEGGGRGDGSLSRGRGIQWSHSQGRKEGGRKVQRQRLQRKNAGQRAREKEEKIFMHSSDKQKNSMELREQHEEMGAVGEEDGIGRREGGIEREEVGQEGRKNLGWEGGTERGRERGS
jgi:hypothetical protein